MRIPRDVGGTDFAQLLKRYGYAVTRQTGSHMRLTTQQGGEHHITIPQHKPLRIGTLNSILKDVADHLKMERDDLVNSIFGE
ncbi:MAG: type II toxin-antitoxin system HicA family toxin [Chloroflexota bacterium]